MPAEGYPCHWSFCRWLAGENAIIERIADPRQAAIALAPFVAALQRIDPTGGPPPERTTFGLGVPLAIIEEVLADHKPLDHEPARLAQTVVYAAKSREHCLRSWRVAKRCCFIETPGDTFAQC
jgi:aminoglycoside phosphotransferase (APT) family kinase protein